VEIKGLEKLVRCVRLFDTKPKAWKLISDTVTVLLPQELLANLFHFFDFASKPFGQ